MKASLRNELRNILLLVLAATSIGLYLNAFWLSLSVALGLYLLWTLKQLYSLLRWLQKNPEAAPPPSTGVCRRVAENIYHIQRTNISIRKRLNTALGRIRESTEALREGVVLFDKKLRIVWWNEASTKLFGLQAKRDEGQAITNLLRSPQFVEFVKKGAYDDTLLMTSPVNELRYLRVSIARFGDGEHLMFARDVTRLQNLEQMRQEFVGNVSHELRTPLTVISGYLEALLDNSDKFEEPVVRALTEVQKQSSRMNTLVQDLMLLSRLGTAKLSVTETPIDVSAMLKSIKLDAEALIPERHHDIALSLETDACLQGNEQELHSAFSNLAFNAVKYTPANGSIKLRWWQDEQGLHYSVQDNGLGIEEKHIPRLTERFYRVDKSRSIDTGGTGLGLAITKHVLLRHGGRLEINSTFGEGSTFTCHFPLSANN